MSQNQRASDHVLPSCFDPKSLKTPDGQTIINTEFVAHSVDPKEADVYWMITCGKVIPPPDSWPAPKPITIELLRWLSELLLSFVPQNCSTLLPCSRLGGVSTSTGWGTGSSEVANVPFGPRPRMGIIKGFASNAHSFRKHYFFVRIDSVSVEESCIRLFQSQWGRKETNILPPFPEDLLTVRHILRGGLYFWGHFSPERVLRAVAYNCSQLQPDLPVDGESETDMEEFVPYDIPGERERSRSRKNKLIAVEDYDNGDVDRLEYPSDELFCNFLDGQASWSGSD
ncbi:hypothetical protein F2Q70_00009111 [Brassica cretica]|uniref:Uncharacterized protein n=1 Tax=Brassica cretica TaxID=69181 RepID=A0A8S9LZ04_BRACR|nr:hypothetical protein F2Q70_00009111 [Brassica cretica]